MIYDQSMSQFISAREIWEFLAENIQEILEGGGFSEESCLRICLKDEKNCSVRAKDQFKNTQEKSIKVSRIVVWGELKNITRE